MKKLLLTLSFGVFLLSFAQAAKAFTISCDPSFQCRDAMGRDVYVACQRVVCDRTVGPLRPDGMLSGLCRVSTSPADRNPTCCTSYAECDDRNACTKDECNLTTNTCVHTMSLPPSTPPDECKQWDCRLSDGVWNLVPTSDGMACRDDGNSCTLDRCQMGACAHPALPSPTTPPMPCYQWSCLGGSTGWIQTPNDTLSCDDGNPCTNTACRSGHCQDITTPAEASLLCPRPRCTALDAATTCDDRDPCTVDTCSSGFCRNSPVTAASIDDSNLCTQDMCSPDRGITHTPLVFNDNNVCTTDSCDARTGLPLFVPRPVEDDGNPCTKDVCDPVFGMLHSLDISRGYECFEGSDCDMSTCRRRIVSIPTCTVDCRQPFMSLIGIRVVPQNESNVQCAFSLNTQGVTGISCRGESGDFTTSGSLPVETGTTGLKTIRAFCKTPSDYRFSCEDNLSVMARVGSGGSGGQVGSGGMNGAAGSGGISLQASGGGSGRGSAGSGGISPPIPTVVGFSNYDVYFCVANETTAFNLRGERIELATPCPELPVAQAVEDDQRLIAETLLDVDPASDHFAQNVRPLIALTVQKWMSSEMDRSLYALQTGSASTSSMSFRQILPAEKPIVRSNFNRYFRVTAYGIENQMSNSTDAHPLFSENASTPQAILLNFERIYAEGGGCSLILHE